MILSMSPFAIPLPILCLSLTALPTQLTGGGGDYNIYNAIVAQDTISFGQVTSLTTYRFYSKGHSSSSVNKKDTTLSFKGLFGCAEAYKQCTSDSPADCLTASSTCPAGPPASSLFEGTCPESNKGIEAGWTFNVGGPASAMAVPEQAFKAGLISKKVVSGLLADWTSCNCTSLCHRAAMY